MYNDSIEAAEAITFWTKTEIKKGRKYDRRVAVKKVRTDTGIQ